MHASQTYKIIVGLGNPGSAYAHTYHNVGALFVEFLAHTHSLPLVKRQSFSYYRDNTGLYLLPPSVFMNQTGVVVKKALSQLHISPEAMLVAHDDFDLPIGTIRLSFARGSAGHLGVESITAALHTNRFTRLRIGARSQPGKAGALVLARISAKDTEEFTRVFQSLAITNSI